MYKSTELFINELKKAKITYQFESAANEDDVDWVQVTSALDNLPAAIIQLFFVEEEVSLRCFGLCKVAEEKMSGILKVINILNTKVQYVKFYINDENEVCLSWDIDLSAKDKGYGERIMDSVRLCLGVVDDNYPILVKEVWKEK